MTETRNDVMICKYANLRMTYLSKKRPSQEDCDMLTKKSMVSRGDVRKNMSILQKSRLSLCINCWEFHTHHRRGLVDIYSSRFRTEVFQVASYFFRAKERVASVLFLKLDVFVYFSLGGDGEENWGKSGLRLPIFSDNWRIGW